MTYQFCRVRLFDQIYFLNLMDDFQVDFSMRRNLSRVALCRRAMGACHSFSLLGLHSCCFFLLKLVFFKISSQSTLQSLTEYKINPYCLPAPIFPNLHYTLGPLLQLLPSTRSLSSVCGSAQVNFFSFLTEFFLRRISTETPP